MIKGIIFDMDGLMFDTERLSLLIWKDLIIKNNMKFYPDFIYQIRGRSSMDAKKLYEEKYYPDATINYEDIKKQKTYIMQEWLENNEIPIKKGLLELLEFLNENKYKLIVASSTKKEIVNKYLEKAGVKKYFFDIVGGDDINKTKPNPDIFLLAAKKISLAANEVLVLEDSLAGVLAANAANMKVVWIPDDIDIPEARKKATITLNNLKEVISFLKNQ